MSRHHCYYHQHAWLHRGDKSGMDISLHSLGSGNGLRLNDIAVYHHKQIVALAAFYPVKKRFRVLYWLDLKPPVLLQKNNYWGSYLTQNILLQLEGNQNEAKP